jgi:hypothetical protein
MGAVRALQVATAQPSVPVAVTGKSFVVNTSVEQHVDPVTGDPCLGAAAGQNRYLKLSVAVSWPGLGTRQPVRSDTLLTPPAGTGATTSVRVRVLNRSGVGVRNATVTLAPTTPPMSVTTIVTDNTVGYGCAVFSNLPKGTYTITVNRAGHVTPAGATTHTETVAADPAEPAPVVVVDYDVAGGARLVFSPVTGFVEPTTATGMVLANPGLRPNGSLTFATSTADGLYPFDSGYQGWRGMCRDADPSSHNASRTRIAVSSGVASTAAPNPQAVPGGRVQVTVRQWTPTNSGVGNDNGTWSMLSGATVIATNSSGSCPDPANPQALTLGVSNSSGVVQALLPYGTWTFRALNRCTQDGSAWPARTATPAAPSVAATLSVRNTTC